MAWVSTEGSFPWVSIQPGRVGTSSFPIPTPKWGLDNQLLAQRRDGKKT